MFYVICPTCHARVEIPAEAVGPDRTDPFNAVCCDECGTGFDYDDDEIACDDDDQPKGSPKQGSNGGAQ
jgi:hypothetical protein